MSSNPGGSGVVEHLKKSARRTTFLLGGRSRSRVGDALGSILVILHSRLP